MTTKNQNSVNDCMSQDSTMTIIRGIIANLGKTFTSQEFIRSFAHRFQKEYVDLLFQSTARHPFRDVNSKIARFMSVHKDNLGISKMGKDPVITIFNTQSQNEKWIKVSAAGNSVDGQNRNSGAKPASPLKCVIATATLLLSASMTHAEIITKPMW